MGSPAYTVFCENGHIVKNVAHHEYNPSVHKECQYCGSTLFHSEIEWQDLDYGKPTVPVKPIWEEWIEVDNHCVRGEIKLSIYDVSKVDDWRNTHL